VHKVQKLYKTTPETKLDVIFFDPLGRNLFRGRHQPFENVPEMLILEQSGNSDCLWKDLSLILA
jgi:hypothetical protein